jgi:hypothetical protein
VLEFITVVVLAGGAVASCGAFMLFARSPASNGWHRALAWKRYAEERGFTFRQGPTTAGGPSANRIAGTIDGVALEIVVDSMVLPLPETRVSAPLPNAGTLRLGAIRIALPFPWRTEGAPTTGDATFDRAIEINANDASLAREILNEDARRALLRAGSPSLIIREGVATLRWSGAPMTPQALDAGIDALIAMARARVVPGLYR